MQMRGEASSNCKRLLKALGDFGALKAAESAAAQRAEQAQLELRARVLAKSAEMELEVAQADLRLLASLTGGLAPKRFTSRDLLLSLCAGAFEMEVVWDAASGCVAAGGAQLRMVDSAAWGGKDAACLEGLFVALLAGPLRVVLAALKHRKQIALVVPHVLHLLGRVQQAREELQDLRRKFTVRTSPTGLAEVTVSCVATLGQVVVQLQLGLLHAHRRAGAPSMIAPGVAALETVARPQHIAHLSPAAIRALVDDHCKDGAPNKATKICNFIYQLIANQ